MPVRCWMRFSSICMSLRSLRSRAPRRLVEQHTRLAPPVRAIATRCCWPPEDWSHRGFQSAQADQLEHFCGFALDICAVQLLECAQTGCNILRNIQVWERRITLERIVDLALVGRNIVQALAVKEYIAREIGCSKPPMMPVWSLPAGRAEQGHELAALDGHENAAHSTGVRQILFSGFADRPDFDSILITLSPNR